MKNPARIAAAAIGGIAITMALIQMQKPAPPQTGIVHVPMQKSGNDPVQMELRRCQALGAAGASDMRCLNAWAEKRSRFFRSNVTVNSGLRENETVSSKERSSGDEQVLDHPRNPPIEQDR